MEMERINGQMGEHTQVVGRIIKWMGMVYILFRAENNTKVNIEMT